MNFRLVCPTARRAVAPSSDIFQTTTSEVSKSYVKALRNVFDHGVRTDFRFEFTAGGTCDDITEIRSRWCTLPR